MPKIELSELYCNIQDQMIASLNLSSSAVVHSGTKGDATENDWISFFRSYLPTRYKVDKGIVIDSDGNQSQQIDIIIYDNHYSYFVFHQDDTLLVPAESVYAVFEVKQNLNKEHIQYAGNKAKSVRELHRTSAPIKHAGGQYPPKELHEIISGLLTTTCDLKEPIQAKVVEYLNERNRNERLDLVCSINNCTFSVNNNVFLSEYDSEANYEILFCESDKSLIYLLLSLLKKLQDIGTVPAISFYDYEKPIDAKRYKFTR